MSIVVGAFEQILLTLEIKWELSHDWMLMNTIVPVDVILEIHQTVGRQQPDTTMSSLQPFASKPNNTGKLSDEHSNQSEQHQWQHSNCFLAQ